MRCSGVGGPISIADREYFKRARLHQSVLDGRFTHRTADRTSFDVVRAIPCGTTPACVIGVVYAAVDLRKLNEGLTSADWPKDATLIVTDRSHTVIAKHPDWQKWVGVSLAADPITAQIGSRLKGTIEYREREEAELFAFEKVTARRTPG